MLTDRNRQLGEEFNRALNEGASDAPWGFTPDRIIELRPTSNDLEAWLLETYFNCISKKMLTRGHKSHFTRKFNMIWNVIKKGWMAVDAIGYPGYYQVWTTHRATYFGAGNLGVVWSTNLDKARQVAKLMFSHVSRSTFDRLRGPAVIHVSFLGGFRGINEEGAMKQAQHDVDKLEGELDKTRSRIANEQHAAETIAARIDAIRAAMKSLPPAAWPDDTEG
jgi:hypothetical protein